MAGARASSCAGCSAATVVASVQRPPRHSPWPCTRPAAACALPSSASRPVSVTSAARSGSAASSSFALRSGSRPSFQRPAALLLMSSVRTTGALAVARVATAVPLSAVVGALLLKAARSSACVLAWSVSIGQGANGRSVARASSACAGRAPFGCARTVACTAGAASGPASVACAAHAEPEACTMSSTASAFSWPVVAMTAWPLALSWSHSMLSRPTRCSAPPAAPRCSCALRLRSSAPADGGAPADAMCNSPT